MERKSTILIVDDTASARKILQDLLSREDYRLLFAKDGQEALATAASVIPDLILLDVMMPGLDGFEVCRRLRADSTLAEVPIVLITALDNDEALLQGIEAGADDFLTKPFNLAELSIRVKTITQLNRYRRLLSERAKFEWVIAQADDGYLVVNEHDLILHANPKARLYLNLPNNDEPPTQETFLALAKKQYYCQPQTMWLTWPDNEEEASLYLIRPESATTNTFWLQVSVLDLPAGPDTTRTIRLRDVTEQMLLHYDIRGFHNLIRHKLLTPLIGVLGSLELLAQQTPELPQTQFTTFVETSYNSALRLHSQVEDILQYLVAPDLTQSSSRFHLSHLGALAREISESLDLAKMSVRVPESLVNCSILLSQGATELVLWEILENAKKFHPTHTPAMEIYTSLIAPGKISLRFADNGVSLSPKQLAQAWTPYYQGEKYFTGEAIGMGLGLPLVASLVWSIGGVCHIYNRDPGPGIVIELNLPIAKSDGDGNEPT